MLLLASGPSLARPDAARARGKVRAIAVNDAWRVAPWADCLYAADAPWWEHHQGVPGFAGEKWIPIRAGRWSDAPRWLAAAQHYDLRPVASAVREGVSLDPSLIYEGFNSGFQALNLSVLFGAARILLLGFDMQPTGGKAHFFGDHPGSLNKTIPFALYRAAFETAAPQLEAAGVEIINCSRETALTCFRRAAIEDFL